MKIDLQNRASYNILQSFEKGLQPFEGEVKQFKDGIYKFINGHWKKQNNNKEKEQESGEIKAELYDKPDMEYPVYKVTINNKDYFIQRSDDMNSGSSWYRVYGNKEEKWHVGKTRTGREERLGDTKQEAIKDLITDYGEEEEEGVEEDITLESMLVHPKTKQILKEAWGEDLEDWIKYHHAKRKNFKPNTYYHVNSPKGAGFPGVGKGLYLGRDKEALRSLYGPEVEEDKKVLTFEGKPKWLNLMDYEDFNNFLKRATNIYGNLPGLEQLKKATLFKRYDGIKYYDPQATGEEFVLYNTDKLKEIK
jgi:hypothetical protein